jgi:molybdopterin molybdotransferase
MNAKSPLTPVADARRSIVSRLQALGTEIVTLENALGRVLAADVVARISHPGADVSAMDGYAVRTDDATLNATLNVIGESAAGHPWSGTLAPGQAVRIFTGAHVPAGADTIVIQEDTTRDGNAVTVTEAAQRGRHIRKEGQDFRIGDVGLTAPRRLTARDVGFLGAMNHASVPVFRRPRVGILSTGDEIVPAGSEVKLGQLTSANGPGLAAFVTARGAIAVNLGIAPDDKATMRAMVERASEVDILITSGGVSVGDHDHLKDVLGDFGLDLAFHRIAMRPGKPLLFGHIRTPKGTTTPVMGLPGNPVAAMICSMNFLGPALAVMQGLPGDPPPVSHARLGTALKANDQREDYLRSTVKASDDGLPVVTPFGVQDSAMVSALARADALVIRPPHAPAANAGDLVPIVMLD